MDPEPHQILNDPASAPWLPDNALSAQYPSWDRILLLLPELASRPDGPENTSRTVDLDDEPIREFRQRLRAGVVARVPEDRFEYIPWSPEAKTLQGMVCVRSVVVVDSYAFATGRLCLLLLDAAGRVVRWVRIAAEDVSYPLVDKLQGKCADSYWLQEQEECGAGEVYGLEGEAGRILYGVEDLLP
jgi:hypothetical protein